MEGRDLYSTLASGIFNKPYEACGDGTPERKACKVILLAIMYGVSAKGVAESLGNGTHEKEAQKIIDDFYKTNPKVRTWIDAMIKACRQAKYVEMLGGRKRRLPSITSNNRGERNRAERQTINSLIQGSAAIQTKLTMIKLYELCQQKGWQLLFSIHDEVAVLAPDTITKEEVDEFNDVMLQSVKLIVPNKSDIELSLRWGEGMTVDEWFSSRERH